MRWLARLFGSPSAELEQAVLDGLKTHPCLVPYAELPAEQRDKDAVFGAIVSALTREE